MPSEAQITEARGRLVEFLMQVLELLSRIAREGRDPRDRRLFDDEIAELIRKAWNEFEQDFDRQRAIGRIRELNGERLQTHGLYGAQLHLKLTLWERIRRRFEGVGGRAVLKKCVEIADTLLGSLLGAAGIECPLEEIKEMIGHATEEETET